MILRLDAEFTVQIARRTEHDAGVGLHDRSDGPTFTAESTLAVI